MKRNIKNLSIKLCYPVETIFMDIVNGITDVKTDEVKYPDTIFYFSNENCIANYNSKNKCFWCDYYKFWSKIYLNSKFNYADIRYLLNSMIEEHFKLKGITTLLSPTIPTMVIEEHFKLKGITTTELFNITTCTVEEHFKLKGITTI